MMYVLELFACFVNKFYGLDIFEWLFFLRRWKWFELGLSANVWRKKNIPRSC